MRFWLAVVCATFVLAGNPARAAVLSEPQTQVLRAAGLVSVLPQRVPEGFTVTSVLAIARQPGPAGGIGTLVVYENYKTGQVFGIESTHGGIGGFNIPPVTTVRIPALGDVTCAIYQFRKPDLVMTDWVGKGPFFRVVGAGYLRERYPESTSIAKDLSLKELGTVVSSLAPFTLRNVPGN